VGKARLCICVPQGHPRQVGPTMANTGWGCSGAILQPLHCAAADKDNARAAVPLSSQRAEAVVNPARQAGSPQPSPVSRYMEILLNQEPHSGEETF
jgi:hypothetical protein